jgi:hypothetical protein
LLKEPSKFEVQSSKFKVQAAFFSLQVRWAFAAARGGDFM